MCVRSRPANLTGIFFCVGILSTREMERELMTYPIWERYTVLSNVVNGLSIRDRRHIFQCVRKQDITPDLFFPSFGFTLSEFAVWHVLGDTRRKAKK